MGHSSQPHWHCPPSTQVERKRQTANNPLPKEGDEEIQFNYYTDRSDLTEIQIQETVKEIHAYAFEGCSSLKTLEFRGGVPRTIHRRAFAKLKGIQSLIIPEGSYESFVQMLQKTIMKKANQPGDTALC